MSPAAVCESASVRFVLRTDEEPSTPVPTVALRSTGQRGEYTAKFMRLLRLNPDIALQNVIPWKLVIAISCAAALVGLFYGQEFLGLVARRASDAGRCSCSSHG